MRNVAWGIYCRAARSRGQEVEGSEMASVPTLSRSRTLLAFGLAIALVVPGGAALASGPSSDTAEPFEVATPDVDTAGIPLVDGPVQSKPTSEEEAQAWSDALVFAEGHPDDPGYPYIDPETGTLELSSASATGAELLNSERSTLKTTATVRDVKFSFGKLEGIKHEVTTLRAEGFPDADLIYMTAPDHESNRIV